MIRLTQRYILLVLVVLIALIAFSIFVYLRHTNFIVMDRNRVLAMEAETKDALSKGGYRAFVDDTISITTPPPDNSFEEFAKKIDLYNRRIHKALYYIVWSGYWPDDMDEKTRKKICLPFFVGVVHVSDTGVPFVRGTSFTGPGRPLEAVYMYRSTSDFIRELRKGIKQTYSEEEFVNVLTQKGYSILKREYNTTIEEFIIPVFDEQLCYPSTREEYNKFFYKDGKFTLPSFKFEPL
ncbi:hypothetical protein [Desulfovibrio litoralis]|uniref:Uncharacterized protein n=1 Tax=Desulfovibrio litoralis DSM 11393 TaxID=1121455 RepID=A0A1M7TR93_9BACT|nr:hypothetical protein [Desulfovibrio litoralis]SHN73133.1 hypothetical protein SAMN02745728_02383 [Desulfovibrio litoralis DSM 11393]